jgi:multimeric flavodoxin WrbA
MGIILGVSGSLRNARFGAGSASLVEEIMAIGSDDGLVRYLESQTRIRLEDFIQAGRDRDLPFDEIHRNLRKAKGDRGLSNSEAALAAGLWGAVQAGAEIRHCGLSRYFPMSGEANDLDHLRELVLQADALLISGPVYFGDRGSPVQEFIEFLRADARCAQHLKGKLYAGIAVGAKRNGGQETTLIYQMVDMANLGMLVVGNSGDNTAQYGGTLYRDDYGIETAVATGKRIAACLGQQEMGLSVNIKGSIRIGVWMLQDVAHKRGMEFTKEFCREVEAICPGVTFDLRDFSEAEIYRCIACDVCPVKPGSREDYRCIIKSEKDLFVQQHRELVNVDAVLLAAYSPAARNDLHSVYQRFLERTRYLRRDDYILADRLAAPLVISEVGSNQNLHIRMLTSLVRHQTILHHPLIGYEHGNEVLTRTRMIEDAMSFVQCAAQLTAGRVARSGAESSQLAYNPVGYEVSAAERAEQEANGVIRRLKQERQAQHELEQVRRVVASDLES